jgi:TonB-dependent receptor
MKKILIALLFFSIGASSTAQNLASIAGRVSDGTGFLPGVNISILGTSVGTATDIEGRYQISNLPIGTITVRLSYLGYETVDREVTLKAGQNYLTNIQLKESTGELQEYVVQGTMVPSQLKAMSIKKNSLAIMDVIAADAIGKLPDRNAAEAVQRLPAVSVNRYHGEANQVSVRGTPYAWSSTLYNGTRLPSANVFGNRSAVLDAIPAEMIQYVQLSKAITPDMEGDAIGGSVNFVTRSAPDSRVLNLSAGGGYSQKSENGTYNGALVYGDRFFKNKLGVIIAGSIWKRNFAADEIVMDYNLTRQKPSERYSLNSMNAKRYFGSRLTAAVNASLEYEFNPSNKIYTRIVKDRFEDTRPVYETFYEFTNKRYRYSNRESDYKTNLEGFEVGGLHKLGSKIKADWSYSNYDMYYRLETPPAMPADQKGLPIAQFFQSLQGDFSGRSSDGLIYNKFDSPDGKGIDLFNYSSVLTNPQADALDPSKLRLEQLIIYQIDQRDEDKVGQINFTFDVNPKLSFKSGGKLRAKNNSGEFTPLVFLPDARLRIPGAKPMRFLNEFTTENFPSPGTYFQELNGQFDAVALNPMTQTQMFEIFSPAYFEANTINNRSSATNATTKFEGSENVMASYLMATYQFSSKFQAYGGFRNEFTQVEMRGNSYDNIKKAVIPITSTYEYNSFLPMIHIKYSPKENINLRAAYTETLARPNFQDLNPAENIDITGGIPRITRGNTQLKPTFSTNLDLMGEVFLSDIGLISAGVFYKKISDFIFRNTAQETISGTNYIVTQPKNIEDASLLGFEAGITKRFSSLPGILSGFGVEANYTRISSTLEVPRLNATGEVLSLDKTTLPNQSKNLFNTSFFYERNGLMLRLAGNFRGNALESINQNLGPDYYIFVDNNFTVDFSGAYSFSDKIKGFVEVRNITNEPYAQYLGDNRNRATTREWHSISGQAGIRLIIF